MFSCVTISCSSSRNPSNGHMFLQSFACSARWRQRQHLMRRALSPEVLWFAPPLVSTESFGTVTAQNLYCCVGTTSHVTCRSLSTRRLMASSHRGLLQSLKQRRGFGAIGGTWSPDCAWSFDATSRQPTAFRSWSTAECLSANGAINFLRVAIVNNFERCRSFSVFPENHLPQRSARLTVQVSSASFDGIWPCVRCKESCGLFGKVFLSKEHSSCINCLDLLSLSIMG